MMEMRTTMKTTSMGGHVVKTRFLGANNQPIFQEHETAPFYENYFLGKDSSKWKTNIYAVHALDYLSLYPGIDLKLYETNSTLKYDIEVAAHANIQQFKVQYEGHDQLYINENGELLIVTSMGTIKESKPFAFQYINGIKTKIACEYELHDNIMQFKFPEGYDSNYPLTIDPELAFSTFTGAGSDNWGMTACPDINKNLIAGGIVFGTSYPTNAGAYDSDFNGGQVDIVLTKYNATGSNIVFSTFLGGDASETPHSLIVNNDNELFVMAPHPDDWFQRHLL